MPQTTEYLQSLQDFELAFLKKYKLQTYLKPTQELILKEIFNRGLQEYELRNMIREIEFNPGNQGCPRCNSQKIRTDETTAPLGLQPCGTKFIQSQPFSKKPLDRFR